MARFGACSWSGKWTNTAIRSVASCAPPEGRCFVPDQKPFALCRRISAETDPKKLTAAIDELGKLLAEEQDEVKSRIAKMLSTSAIAPE
jgi:hypothetical protein